MGKGKERENLGVTIDYGIWYNLTISWKQWWIFAPTFFPLMHPSFSVASSILYFNIMYESILLPPDSRLPSMYVDICIDLFTEHRAWTHWPIAILVINAIYVFKGLNLGLCMYRLETVKIRSFFHLQSYYHSRFTYLGVFFYNCTAPPFNPYPILWYGSSQIPII